VEEKESGTLREAVEQRGGGCGEVRAAGGSETKKRTSALGTRSTSVEHHELGLASGRQPVAP